MRKRNIINWELVFNVEKCKSLHIGTHNLLNEYLCDDNLLDSTIYIYINDLGVLVICDSETQTYSINAPKLVILRLTVTKHVGPD